MDLDERSLPRFYDARFGRLRYAITRRLFRRKLDLGDTGEKAESERRRRPLHRVPAKRMATAIEVGRLTIVRDRADF